jgi:hypothetical protein
LSSYYLARFSFDVRLFKESILSSDTTSLLKNKQLARKSGKYAIRNAKKYAVNRPEIFRLMGLYYWSIDKQQKAVKWWKRAIEENERFGIRPDLARTYMEIGKLFFR